MIAQQRSSPYSTPYIDDKMMEAPLRWCGHVKQGQSNAPVTRDEQEIKRPLERAREDLAGCGTRR